MSIGRDDTNPVLILDEAVYAVPMLKNVDHLG